MYSIYLKENDISDIDKLDEYNKEYSIFEGFKPFATKDNYLEVIENNKKLPIIKKFSHSSLIIQVDGGINAETARICTQKGANSIVAGNYIYNSDNIQDAIESLR